MYKTRPPSKNPGSNVNMGESQPALLDTGPAKLTKTIPMKPKKAGHNSTHQVERPAHTETPDIVLNGTNFRHAVEFSRNGRTHHNPLRPPWGNPRNITRGSACGQIHLPGCPARPAGGARSRVRNRRERWARRQPDGPSWAAGRQIRPVTVAPCVLAGPFPSNPRRRQPEPR